MSKRKEALKWWRSLDHNQCIKYCNEYFPDMIPVAVFTSSSRIEQIYKLVY